MPYKRTILVCSLIAMHSTAGAQERPAALEQAQRCRDQLRTGKIELLRYVAREPRPPVLYSAQFAENGDILVHRGSEDGLWHLSDGSAKAFPPHSGFRTKDEAWSYDDDMVATMQELPSRSGHGENVWRFRALGLSPYLSYQDVHETLWQDKTALPAARTYAEDSEGSPRRVTAKTEEGEITWWLDSERGWNPVRIRETRDGKVQRQARISLKSYDGVWYPERVAYYSGTSEEPDEVVTILSASFNRPDQPPILTVADIGVEAGTNVQVTHRDGQTEVCFSDGKRALSQDEFGRRFYAGEIEYGPKVLRILAEAEAAGAGPTALSSPDGAGPVPATTQAARKARESHWEAYTRRFIAKYRLDQDQAQKALAVLKDCQLQADQHILRHAAEFDQLQRKADAARKHEAPDKDAQLAAVEQHRVELGKAVNEIFERQLKPRLEKLPTRAQRQAAEATSQPGDTKR